jgi:predicted nuclease of predicted toxin-antitoxin system
MRFLIDRCAGSTVAGWLRQEGHDVLEARSLGPDPGDERLLQIAREQSRVVVTIDSDFGTIIFRDRASHSGLVRLSDVPVSQRIEIMRVVLERHGADLAAGAIVTVRGDRIRVSF